MADTGAPWNLPYPLPTDLVRDGAQAIEDLAEATATGLSAAGGLVAVKHALLTDRFSSASVPAGDSIAVPGLSVTHEVADAANRLIISAYFGACGSGGTTGFVGLAVHDGTSFIAIGDEQDDRTQVTAGGRTDSSPNANVVSTLSATFVHTPGSGEKTYTVHAVNIDSVGRGLLVNRSSSNANEPETAVASSGLVVQEVKV